MAAGGAEGSRWARWGIVLLVALLIVAVAGIDPADARGRKRIAKRAPAYNPPSAAIVVDVNSGQVLHAANADAIRHPASLTKIMTLYLLFEQIEAGKLKLDSELEVSAHAASQAPSKLGLRPGQTITVENAIKALVTKSANDVAVVVAEGIGGDEDDFAKLMTRKARALGMAKTVYANASGLPDDDQVTSARDQATLGRAIQDRFPKLYRYFATPSFTYHGRGMRNHNRLLGVVPGVDGIKTGYVRKSGFNLVANMRRGDRHVVAVVMGGASGRVRDARMRQLLEGYIVTASARRTAPKLAEAPAAKEPEIAAPVEPRTRPRLAAAEPAAQVVSADPRLPAPVMRAEPAPPVTRAELPAPPVPLAAAPAPGSAEPIQPIMVKTVTVKRAPVQAGALAAAPPAAVAGTQAAAYTTTSEAPPAPRPGVLGTLPLRQVASAGQAVSAAAVSEPPPSANRPGTLRGDWMIQIGAFPEEDKARERLKSAQDLARPMLAAAAPFTERVTKGDTTLYRARFAGFDKDRAEAACKYLKRNEIACLALKN